MIFIQRKFSFFLTFLICGLVLLQILFLLFYFVFLLSLDRSAKRMPIDVIDALKEVITECSSHKLDAEEYIKSMEAHKRLQLETWA